MVGKQMADLYLQSQTFKGVLSQTLFHSQWVVHETKKKDRKDKKNKEKQKKRVKSWKRWLEREKSLVFLRLKGCLLISTELLNRCSLMNGEGRILINTPVAHNNNITTPRWLQQALSKPFTACFAPLSKSLLSSSAWFSLFFFPFFLLLCIYKVRLFRIKTFKINPSCAS